MVSGAYVLMIEAEKLREGMEGYGVQEKTLQLFPVMRRLLYAAGIEQAENPAK